MQTTQEPKIYIVHSVKIFNVLVSARFFTTCTILYKRLLISNMATLTLPNYEQLTSVYIRKSTNQRDTPKEMVRIKNRYIVVRIVPQAPVNVLKIDDAILAKCVLRNVKKYYGDYGQGTVEHGFRVKYCNERTKIAIIRCLHRSHRTVTSTLPLITMIGDVRAKFHTLYVGATIIHCNKFIINHQQRFLDEMVGQIASAKERKDFIKRVMEFDLEQ